MIYYISDPHFGHANIITLCNRPFIDIDEMDRTLIANWNARVRNEDSVYVLGDFAYKCELSEVAAILQKLNGHMHLLIGNHDEWMNKMDAGEYFESVDNMVEINDNGRICVLCHYPLLTWRKENKSFMVYGHIHDKTDADFWPLIVKRDRMLNAGVEINNYMPVTLDEMISNNNAFKKASNSCLEDPEKPRD